MEISERGYKIGTMCSAGEAIALDKFQRGHFASSSRAFWLCLGNAALYDRDSDMKTLSETLARTHPCRTCSSLLLEALPSVPWREAESPLEKLLLVVTLRNLFGCQIELPDVCFHCSGRYFSGRTQFIGGERMSCCGAQRNPHCPHEIATEPFTSSKKAQSLLKSFMRSIRDGRQPTAQKMTGCEKELHMRGLCSMP